MRFITASMLGQDLLRSFEEMHKACSESANGLEPSGSKSLAPKICTQIASKRMKTGWKRVETSGKGMRMTRRGRSRL